MSTEKFPFPRGSEWRKWDLHIHSPNTHLSNDYGEIQDEDFIKKLKEEELSAIGLTNYFNFPEEDFELKNKIESEGILVLLNLELRLTYQNTDDDCCDLHLIFEDEINKNKINDFLGKLNVNYNGGEKLAKNLNQTNEFKGGAVEFEELNETLNEESLGLENKYLMGFLSRGSGNSRSSTMYEKVEKNSHFLIHSTDSDENLKEDRKFWIEHDKALLQSSDAHEISEIGEKFTWIKADPTFEGLRQIVFEPEDRVAIKPTNPQSKKPYQTIESVKFIDNEEPDRFPTSKIPINKNLNSIIGGKSTGKSLLLYHIAKTIDESEVETRFETLKGVTRICTRYLGIF